MKKNYTLPLTVEVNVEAEQMLAASLSINNDKEIDTSDPDAQLGGDRRGEWGNLWK